MLNIVVLVSGGGTNFQALIDAQEAGKIHNGHICAVLSSSQDAYALIRAHKAGIPAYVVERKSYASREAFTAAILDELERLKADLIVLSGFLYVLSDSFIERYRNRIINVHPSLIPAFCGDGYYGIKVHEKALERGVKLSGATVHFVNEVTDGGPIILQKAVEVLPDDTAQSLQQRVMQEAEWKLLPKAVSLFCAGRLNVAGGRVRILEAGV